nr:hypothetical protein [Geodermatophilaceae bacterium]
ACLLDEVGRWTGRTTVVSVELLNVASPATAMRIVGSFAPADVHIVITARDLARVIPSSWQETIQNGLVWTWDEFVASVVSRPGATKLVRRWADVVGPDHVVDDVRDLVPAPRGGSGDDQPSDARIAHAATFAAAALTRQLADVAGPEGGRGRSPKRGQAGEQW